MFDSFLASQFLSTKRPPGAAPRALLLPVAAETLAGIEHGSPSLVGAPDPRLRRSTFRRTCTREAVRSGRMKLPRREVGSRRSGVESRRRYRGPTAQSG